MPKEKTLTIPPSDSGERLDRWLAQALGASRRQVMQWIDEGRVRVDGRRAKKSDEVRVGSEIRIALPPGESPVPQPELPLEILYEDSQLIALNKPAGVACHPLVPGETGTLANAVLAHFPDVSAASEEERCPGLLHRLDHHTSGVLLWARTPSAFHSLREQFFRRSVDKRYLSLVEGHLPVTEGEKMQEIDFPIAHHPKNTRKMLIPRHEQEAKRLKARIALSRFRVLSTLASGASGRASERASERALERASEDSSETVSEGVSRTGEGSSSGPAPVSIEAQETGYSLLEVQIVTGLRHQIRIHLSHMGHPVLGDELYGAKAMPELGRHFLHASSIGFQHPSTGAEMRIEAPLPRELVEVLEGLGWAEV